MRPGRPTIAGVQAQEIFYILIIALVVLGPQRMPGVAKRLGKWAYELRKAATELRSGLEAEVGDIGEIKRDLLEPVKQVQDDVKAPLRELKRDVEKPVMEMKSAGEAAVSGAAAVVKRGSYEPKKPAGDAADRSAGGAPDDAQATEHAGAAPVTGEDPPGESKPLRWIGPDPSSGPTPDDAAQDLAEIEATGGAVTDEVGTDETEAG